MNRKNSLCGIAALFFVLYLLLCLTPASANEDDWDSLVATLNPENSIISKDEYTLEALKFDGYGMVWVQVSKNNVGLGDAVLENNSSGWCYMDGNNIRLKACNVTDQRTLPLFGSLCSPEAEIVFETKRYAQENVTLELDLDLDKEEYLLDDDIILGMELRNTGEVKTGKIKLDVDSDGLLVQKGCPENIVLDKGAKKSSELRFKFPEKVKENYNIHVKVNWEDSSGEHLLSKAVDIELTEPLEIYKNTGSEAFTGGSVYVTISVKNIQKRAVNISLLDLLPETFEIINSSGSNFNGLVSNNSNYLSWDLVLAPEEIKTFSYCINSEQPGAHRVPQAHAYSDLCGKLCTESSDSENIITVYENISYIEYHNKTLTEVILPSGADLSAYLDKNGYSLLDIRVENKLLDASVFIPAGTRLLDRQKEPLKTIAIEEAEQPSLPGSLIPVGKCYGLEPEGAEFDPFASISLGLESSIDKSSPAVYCYNGDNSTWTLFESTLNERRISAEITDFSIYTVLAEPQKEVKLKVKVVPP